MSPLIKTTLLSAVWLSAASVPTSAKDLIIGIDISDSAPIAMEKHIADRAAKLASSRIAAMKRGDSVKIRSLGLYGTAAQTIYMNARLSRKARPHKVARNIHQLIRSLPSLAKKGRIKLQTETNIIGFLEVVAPSLDCKTTPTTILILSDSIEHSAYISGRELLSGKKQLPSPSGPILAGCTLEMRGMAQQHKKLKSDPRWFARLRKNWARFAKSAGVSRFKAYAEYR